MRLAIRKARLIDPATGRDGAGDLYIADGKISAEAGRVDRTIDAKGLVVCPGFVDIAARLREPGFEYKATLESELEAALAGGVTSLACPPDTDPPLDEPGLVDMLRRRAKALSRARVYPIGALTVKLEGERLTEMAQLAEAGCVAFSQANARLPIRRCSGTRCNTPRPSVSRCGCDQRTPGWRRTASRTTASSPRDSG